MKARVHLVDDELTLLWVLKEYLDMHGFDVATDTDPRAALIEMQKNLPDIAVVDVLMPSMDGFTLLERMRMIPALADVPVIFLTAVSDLSARLKGFQGGADDYICKPFEASELKARITAVLWRTKNSPVTSTLFLDTDRNLLIAEGQEVLLTPSETLLMSYFLAHQHALVTTEELLREALGYAENTGSPATVRYHIRNLRNKFQKAHLRTVRLETVGRSGYYLAMSALT
jgi:DNA-binding response OmpR family regulator